MTLNKPLKIVLGIATLIVFLIPVGILLLWMVIVFPLTFIPIPNELPFSSFDPFQFFEKMSGLIFFMGCLLNLLIYGLVAFYIIHAIMNKEASDVFRILFLIFIFFIPYLRMLIYYLIYILMSPPPSWALKLPSASA